MPASKAQQKAVSKYMKENYDEIKVRVDKGRKAKIKAHAETLGESVNGFIGRAIDETMARDSEKSIAQEASMLELSQAEQDLAEPVTAPKPSKAPRPSNTVIKAFTEQDAQRIDYKRLLRDFRYQFEIQDLYGKAVLSDLLTRARALPAPEQDNTPSRTPMEELTSAVMNRMAAKGAN